MVEAETKTPKPEATKSTFFDGSVPGFADELKAVSALVAAIKKHVASAHAEISEAFKLQGHASDERFAFVADKVKRSFVAAIGAASQIEIALGHAKGFLDEALKHDADKKAANDLAAKAAEEAKKGTPPTA